MRMQRKILKSISKNFYSLFLITTKLGNTYSKRENDKPPIYPSNPSDGYSAISQKRREFYKKNSENNKLKLLPDSGIKNTTQIKEIETSDTNSKIIQYYHPLQFFQKKAYDDKKLNNDENYLYNLDTIDLSMLERSSVPIINNIAVNKIEHGISTKKLSLSPNILKQTKVRSEAEIFNRSQKRFP